MRLGGRRVLVTGASRGIGAALARGFAARGAGLALVARSAEALQVLADEVDGRAYPADLSDVGAIPELVRRIEADGPIDVLVNNAGVSHVGWFLDRTVEELDQVLTLNLHAPLRLCHAVLPGMVERRRGTVVNISSMAAVFAPPGLVTYGASKAGLSHMTAGLRADLRDQPLTFINVHLGSVKTDMDDEARSYGPLRQLAEQSAGRDITPMEQFVAAVVRAVEQNREEVRVPRAMAPLAAATNFPRRVGRLIFKRTMVKEPRPDRP